MIKNPDNSKDSVQRYNSRIDTKLANLRNQIDMIDYQLIDLINERQCIAKKIGEYKRSIGMNKLDKNRWQSLVKDRVGYSQKYNIDEIEFRKILELLHKLSLCVQ